MQDCFDTSLMHYNLCVCFVFLDCEIIKRTCQQMRCSMHCTDSQRQFIQNEWIDFTGDLCKQHANIMQCTWCSVQTNIQLNRMQNYILKVPCSQHNPIFKGWDINALVAK